jgi:hypothetical protein
MPNLFKVCVWEMPFPPASIQVVIEGSPNAYFTTDCSINALNTNKESNTIDIYPNPSDDIINIEIGETHNATIEIYSVGGRHLYSKVTDSKTEQIDLSDYTKGIYLVKFKQVDRIYIEKVVVR